MEIKTKQGRFIGTLNKNVFSKRVSASRHLFRKLDAWGMDYEILYKLPEKTVVRITDLESQTIYQVPIKEWKSQGIILHFKEGTADHNTQVFLPRDKFTQIGIPRMIEEDGVRKMLYGEIT
jgi:hypothetical protein